MPTHRQFELLKFIRHQIKTTGVSPSYQEMADSMGVKSKSNCFRIVQALEKLGYIRMPRHTKRSIEVIRMPEDPIENEPTSS